jgi:membrane-bound lytic murein transglycosylase D
MNGDWHLALASYNWGEHAVARAIAKNRAKHLPTDYSHLKMPGETSSYVPKLQALKNIIAQPELFGIQLEAIPNQAYFGTVDKPADMDVTIAASLAEIPMEELIALNPAYNRPVMPANKGSPLLVPADKVDIFRANLLRHEGEDKSLNNWETYSLKKGEKLDAVAAHHGISVVRLRQINGITARTKIGPGHTLLVPGKDAQASAALLAANLPAAPPERRAGKHARHTGKSHHKHAAPTKPSKKHSSTQNAVK